jgi:hypothetical protein
MTSGVRSVRIDYLPWSRGPRKEYVNSDRGLRCRAYSRPPFRALSVPFATARSGHEGTRSMTMRSRKVTLEPDNPRLHRAHRRLGASERH